MHWDTKVFQEKWEPWWNKNFRGRVCLDKSGPTFEIKQGVKHGEPLSTNLFNSLLEEVFQKLNWGGRGVKINGLWLNNLRFAADGVLMSRDGEDLQKMTKELECEACKVGLKINHKKTVLISNQNTQPEIMLSNNKILVENSTIYLVQDNCIRKEPRPWIES